MEFTAHDFSDLVWRVSSQLTLARPVCALVTNFGGQRRHGSRHEIQVRLLAAGDSDCVGDTDGKDA